MRLQNTLQTRNGKRKEANMFFVTSVLDKIFEKLNNISEKPLIAKSVQRKFNRATNRIAQYEEEAVEIMCFLEALSMVRKIQIKD